MFNFSTSLLAYLSLKQRFKLLQTVVTTKTVLFYVLCVFCWDEQNLVWPIKLIQSGSGVSGNKKFHTLKEIDAFLECCYPRRNT